MLDLNRVPGFKPGFIILKMLSVEDASQKEWA